MCDFCVCCSREKELCVSGRGTVTVAEEILHSGEANVILVMPPFPQVPFLQVLQRHGTKTFDSLFNSDDADPSPSSQTKKKVKRSERITDTCDVFLSYMINADHKLDEVIYWWLIGCDVVVNGVSRKLRVFWDVKCLFSGVGRETGFCRALCSSTLHLSYWSSYVKHFKVS